MNDTFNDFLTFLIVSGIGATAFIIFWGLVRPAWRRYRIRQIMENNTFFFNAYPQTVRGDGMKFQDVAEVYAQKDMEQFITICRPLDPAQLQAMAIENYEFPPGSSGGRVSSMLPTIAQNAIRDYLNASIVHGWGWDLIADEYKFTGEEVSFRLSKKSFFKNSQPVLESDIGLVYPDGSVEVGSGL